MKLTEEQIWKCNNDGEGGVHICLEHQNVVDFARAIEAAVLKAQPVQTVSMVEYKRLQDLVTSQGIRLMQYESMQPAQKPLTDGQKENERLHRQNAVLLREKLKAEAEAKEWFAKYQALTAHGIKGDA